MHLNHRTIALIAPLLVAAYTPSYADSVPDVIHTYEIVIKDISAQPIEGAAVTFTAGVRAIATKTECTTDASGLCKLEVAVSSSNPASSFKSYISVMSYSVSKTGFYSESGRLLSSYGSDPLLQSATNPFTKESLKKVAVTIYRPTDYLSEEFAASPVDRDLRDQALKFMSLIRLQSLIVDADVMLRGMGTSSFKSKKYFQMKINTTTTFNSLKLDKYAIAKRLFDDSIRKILNPLNENISNPKSFYGYDLTIYGYTKSFANEYASPEKIEYRFLIPQDTVRRYKDKDISGQQVLDASVILMNDERIELKLQ